MEHDKTYLTVPRKQANLVIGLTIGLQSAGLICVALLVGWGVRVLGEPYLKAELCKDKPIAVMASVPPPTVPPVKCAVTLEDVIKGMKPCPVTTKQDNTDRLEIQYLHNEGGWKTTVPVNYGPKTKCRFITRHGNATMTNAIDVPCIDPRKG